MARDCNCSGGCGPQSDVAEVQVTGPDGVTRREFITLVGAGTAGLLVGGPVLAVTPGAGQTVSAQNVPSTVPAAELAAWQRSLHAPAAPRVYKSGTHTDARMHLGGIGTGNFEIGADGQLTTWQLFNTLRDGHVPFYFAVRAGNAAKLLQTAGGPDWPRVAEIEMTGEYPLATLRYMDKDLPVQLEMTAFTPFAPLDTRLSSMPLAAFVFRVHNPTRQAQTVSLASFLTNPIGYDATGQINGVEHANFGGNTNAVVDMGQATVLSMTAVPGTEPTLDTPVNLYTNLNLGALHGPPADRPRTLTVQGLDRIPAAAPVNAQVATTPRSVIWIENAPNDLPVPALRAARDAVQAGATLVFAGNSMPLLETYAQVTGGKPLEANNARPDVVFEDFENGYAQWTVEGTAFGQQPARGTLPNQQQVAGFMGKQLVNSFTNGDDTTGRLISKPFTIERNFIRFLVGGGSHPTTQIRLIVNGKTVRAAAGRNDERLLPATWDVHEFAGQTAHLEIVDQQTGAWGHINVDQIEFADLPGSGAVLDLLNELLPVRFSGITPDAAHPGQVVLQNPQPAVAGQGAGFINALNYYTRTVGKGTVILATGTILKPGEEPFSPARQRAYSTLGQLVGVRYTASGGILPTAPGFGSLALGVLDPDAVGISDIADPEHAWKQFSENGMSTLNSPQGSPPSPPGRTFNGALMATVHVPAGKTVEVPFLLAWHYPNKYANDNTLMGNHYATQWPDARAVLREAVANYPTLRSRTERFRKTFYDSTLPYWLLDCVTSQASIIRHIGVVFRIGNGDIYGWEGSNGCCQPTCTHVWGYEQSLARLFPDLEREMRRIDYTHQQTEDGGINNRTAVPSPPRPSGEHPFVDGHASCILKAYREALNHQDDAWLKTYWPGIQRAVEYLIKRDAATSGGTPDGTLEDDQWNTYDEALHGVTTFIGTYYLAALRAGEELARRRGDNAAADRYHGIFEQGQKKLVELCWNGEYFQQNLADYDKRPGEIGPGCMADQLIGQWWAHQLGLGYVLPKEHVRTALKAVFKYNFLTDHTNWQHNWRKFAGGKDKGLLIATWPKGGRPASPMLYIDEVWTGIEYQVASHMIYEGMMDEAFAIIKGARDRYDGIPRAPMGRNPWNEIECGGHYARAMSSWSLLLALSGWEYDGISKVLRFAPRATPEAFKACFTGPAGWGSAAQTRRAGTQTNEFTVVEGRLPISRLHLNAAGAVKQVQATAGKTRLRPTMQRAPDGVTLTFPTPVVVMTGQTLTVRLG